MGMEIYPCFELSLVLKENLALEYLKLAAESPGKVPLLVTPMGVITMTGGGHIEVGAEDFGFNGISRKYGIWFTINLGLPFGDLDVELGEGSVDVTFSGPNTWYSRRRSEKIVKTWGLDEVELKGAIKLGWEQLGDTLKALLSLLPVRIGGELSTSITMLPRSETARYWSWLDERNVTETTRDYNRWRVDTNLGVKFYVKIMQLRWKWYSCCFNKWFSRRRRRYNRICWRCWGHLVVHWHTILDFDEEITIFGFDVRFDAFRMHNVDLFNIRV